MSINKENMAKLAKQSTVSKMKEFAVDMIANSNTAGNKKARLTADLMNYTRPDQILKTMWNVFLSGEGMASFDSGYGRLMGEEIEHVPNPTDEQLDERWGGARGLAKKPDPLTPERTAELMKKGKDGYIDKVLKQLNKMSISKGEKGTIESYAFDIVRSFKLDMSARELAKLYRMQYENTLHLDQMLMGKLEKGEKDNADMD